MLSIFRNARKIAVAVFVSAAILTGFSAPTFAASFRPQINITNSSAPAPEPTPGNSGKIYWLDGRIQKPGEGEDAVVQIEYDLSLFNSLTINGEELTLNEEYYLEEGSTIITLTGGYMSGLGSGNYTLAAKYSDGKEFSTVFAISDDPESVDASLLVPDTGSMTIQNIGSNLGKNIPFIILILLIISVAVWIFRYLRTKNIKNSFGRGKSDGFSRYSSFKMSRGTKGGFGTKFSGLKPKTSDFIGRFQGFGCSNSLVKKHIYVPIVACAVLVLGGAYVFTNVFVPSSDNNEVQAADDGQGSLSLSATNESFVNDVDLSNGSVFVSTSQTLTVNSATSHGYKLYISTDSPEYNDLSINGSVSADARIAASSNTSYEPAVLEADTYGWAIANDSFGSNYSPSVNSKWAGVPVSGSEEIIKDVTNATSAGDATQIYYGFNITNNLPDGSYYGTSNSTIVYSIVANVLADYEINYYCNGGSGIVAPQAKTTGAATELRNGTECELEGYHITGWNTVSDGSGDSYALGKDGGSFTKDEHVNLYAVWAINEGSEGGTDPAPEKHTFVLSYDANGGSNAPARMSRTTTETSASFTVDSKTPSRKDYTFIGWCDAKPVYNSSTGIDGCSGTSYQSSGTVTLDTGSATLYGRWKRDKVSSITISSANNKSELLMNKQGDMITLQATVKPDSAKSKSITWRSSNNNVAKVSSSGQVVAGTEPGRATITVMANDGSGAYKTFSVTVRKKVLILLGASQLARINGSKFANIRTYKSEKSGNVYTTSVSNQYSSDLDEPKKLDDSLNFIYFSGRGFQFETGANWTVDNKDSTGFWEIKNHGWTFAKKIVGHYKSKKEFVDFYIYFTPVGNDFKYYNCGEIQTKGKKVEVKKEGVVTRNIVLPNIQAQAETYYQRIDSLTDDGYNVKGYVTSIQPLGPVASGGKKKNAVVENGTTNSCEEGYRSNYKFALVNYWFNEYMKGMGGKVTFVNMFKNIVNYTSKNEKWSFKEGWTDYKTSDGIHWTDKTAKKYFNAWMDLNTAL